MSTLNNTDPDLCSNFTSRRSLIDFRNADTESYNATMLVLTCAELCSLVVGSGNPDISGIGAYVSLCIQGAFAFFFGPILVLVFALTGSHRYELNRHSRNHWFVEMTFDIAAKIGTTNILTAMAFLITSILHLQQAPSASESKFITYTVLFQFFIAYQIALASVIVRPLNIQKYYLFYICVVASVPLFAGTKISQSENGSAALHMVTQACIDYRDYPGGLAESADDFTGRDRLVYITFYASVLCGLFTGALAWARLRPLVSLNRADTSASRKTFRSVPRWLLVILRILTIMLLLTLVLGSGVHIVVDLYFMQKARNLVEMFSVDEYEDGEWGFGQVMAVLLWFPAALEIFDVTMNTYVDRCREMKEKLKETTKPHGKIDPPATQKPTTSTDDPEGQALLATGQPSPFVPSNA